MKSLSQYIKEAAEFEQSCFITIWGDAKEADIKKAVAKSDYAKYFNVEVDDAESRVIGFSRDFRNDRELFHALNALYDDLESSLPECELSAPTFADESDEDFIEYVTFTSDTLNMNIFFEPAEVSEQDVRKKLEPIIKKVSNKLNLEISGPDNDNEPITIATVSGAVSDFKDSSELYLILMKVAAEVGAKVKFNYVEVCDPTWDEDQW